ncbi:2-methylcitrate dehydratase PrpD [Pseudomonas sp. BP6]|uniref:hypothetical protein n=1 Tax=Pseudomonas putida TaxID=303 RepID=UPI001AE9C34F|nr:MULTISPECIES: hypothetical protein [Pseudomonas]MBP2271412.1 2-methylcitrate dehydratase PrpD [Pseudomonas sp. BP6]MBP2289617.1 2-methylcitrate dehydratase PrpD [Pseudomonas sp. BP7]HDS1697822.1 hypothetical protein [Pseudomonas putida]HDS1703045.1 hypothetical protein [Pseudomonas putida]
MADLTMTLSDGTHLFVEQPIGSLENPMSEAQQDAKFMELTAEVLGEQRARALLATLRELPLKAPVTDLTALFAA